MLLIRGIWKVLRQEILKATGNIAGREPFSIPAQCLIIAPHMDDEVLGCGGLLASQAIDGNRSDILFLTEGEAAHGGCCPMTAREIGTKRQRLAVTANKILGVSHEHLHFFAGRDGNLPQQGQPDFNILARRITEYIIKTAPAAVFCPHPFGGWSDHIAAEKLTRTAFKMLPPGPMPLLYHYCVWFWYSMPLKRAWLIDWRQARLLDIAAQLPLKRKAMHAYLDSLAPCGHPWIGKLPSEFLRAFDWDKELFFEADIIKAQGRGKPQ
jgi:LmbE family N-acetylglucosaminyl deacetylase